MKKTESDHFLFCDKCSSPLPDAYVDLGDVCCSDPHCPERRARWSDFLERLDRYQGLGFVISFGVPVRVRRKAVTKLFESVLSLGARTGIIAVDGEESTCVGVVPSVRDH